MDASVDGSNQLPNLCGSSCLNQLLGRLSAEAGQRLFLEPLSSTLA